MGVLRCTLAMATLQLAGAILGNTYNFRCEPGGIYSDDPALAVGEKSYVCIIVNGKVTTLFNVEVDRFSAISVQGCESIARYNSPRDLSHMISTCSEHWHREQLWFSERRDRLDADYHRECVGAFRVLHGV